MNRSRAHLVAGLAPNYWSYLFSKELKTTAAAAGTVIEPVDWNHILSFEVYVESAAAAVGDDQVLVVVQTSADAVTWTTVSDNNFITVGGSRLFQVAAPRQFVRVLGWFDQDSPWLTSVKVGVNIFTPEANVGAAYHTSHIGKAAPALTARSTLTTYSTPD